MNGKRVLVAPLDWGLGHATRCIPVIRELQRQNAGVVIAASGYGLALLRQEFPSSEIIEVPGYPVRYPRGSNMVWAMAKQAPRLLRKIAVEHGETEKIISDRKIDAVISDNRYGVWSDKVKSVFITHQLRIRMPRYAAWAGPAVNFLNRRYISRFSRCWVPDYEDEPNLSGALSHGISLRGKTAFVGPLSRFVRAGHNSPYQVVISISGPEPQRTVFEEVVLSRVHSIGMNTLVARGLPGTANNIRTDGKVTIADHLASGELNQAFSSAKVVISRAGYSTIMDLACLGVRAVLVPTPGQTEQEYLARRFQRDGIYTMMDQENFNLSKAIQESQNFRGMARESTSGKLAEEISWLLA